jgi:predicted PurR-regulated permease PerM
VSEGTFVRRVLIALGLALLVYILWELRGLLLMLFGAVVVATIFRALADRLRQWLRLGESLAVAASILIILGAALLLVVLFGQHVSQQAEVLDKTLPAAWRSFELRMAEMGLGDELDRVITSVRESLSPAGYGQAVLGIGNAIAEGLVVLVAGVFLAAQPRFYATGALELFPESRRPLIGKAMTESETALRLWLKGQLIAMAAVGTLTGVGLWALGVPSALVLGLIAGLLEFVPYLGPILSAVPGILLALAVSPDLAIWVALLYFAVQQFEGYVLTPLVQQYAVELPGVVLLFSLLAFGTLFGTLGIVLAAPLTVVTYVLVKRLYVIEALHTPTPIPGEKAD